MKTVFIVASLILPLGAPVRAAVVYTGSHNEFLITPNQPVERAIDLNDDGIDDFVVRATTEDFSIIPLLSNRVHTTLPSPPDIGTWIIPHASGSILGSSVMNGTIWSSRIEGAFGPMGGTLTACQLGGAGIECLGYWSGMDAYAGLEFLIDGHTHYGWIRIEAGSSFNGGWIRDYAYESIAGADIAAGQIPEPSPIIFLAGGLLTTFGRRRRNNQGITRRSRATDGAAVLSERQDNSRVD